jgi:hypothetical protein
MLPLEAIGVLGFLYLFFMVGTVKAIRAKGTVRHEAKVKPMPVVKGLGPETAEQPV